MGNLGIYASEWWCNAKIKRSKSRSLGTKNVQIVFVHILVTIG